MVYFLVYVSSATRLLSRQDLDDILATSHRNNVRRDISGALLYKDGNLMQVLEGEETAVRELYATIDRDPRHKGTILILDGTRASRQFEGWSMAFRDLNSPEAISHPGYSDFLNTRFSSPEFTDDPSMAHRLLATFKETM